MSIIEVLEKDRAVRQYINLDNVRKIIFDQLRLKITYSNGDTEEIRMHSNHYSALETQIHSMHNKTTYRE
jgi:hypothetical protein